MVICRISSEQLLEMRNHEFVINSALMTSEAHLFLSGQVGREDYCNCSAENSHELHQKPPHRDKLNSLNGVVCFGVLGLYFFEDDESAAVIATSYRYLEILGIVCETDLCLPGIDHFFSLVSAEWGNCPNSKDISECSVRNISSTPQASWP